MKYEINEIFYSIQGEGYWTGTPAVFIRFSGCNLACSFCDTNHQSNENVTQDELLERIFPYPSHHIILTGGEPTLQLNSSLCECLQEKGYFLQLETNGTQEISYNIDWITVSPKVLNTWKVRQGHELKVVYQGQDLALYANTNFQHYFLQPCSMQNIGETVEIVKRYPTWKLSIQIHKLLNIP